ncbi:Uncharacterised protein [Mycobacterium tuberculosis]|nr:Uncharacterised protein [Mycobacterium tuberculosis]
MFSVHKTRRAFSDYKRLDSFDGRIMVGTNGFEIIGRSFLQPIRIQCISSLADMIVGTISIWVGMVEIIAPCHVFCSFFSNLGKLIIPNKFCLCYVSKIVNTDLSAIFFRIHPKIIQIVIGLFGLTTVNSNILSQDRLGP